METEKEQQEEHVTPNNANVLLCLLKQLFAYTTFHGDNMSCMLCLMQL